MPFTDFAYAARTLRKTPVFTLTAVVALALGIGASTAIFSVVHGVLLRPLPYKNPGRLVIASGEMRKRNVKDWPFSNADFFDMRNGTKGAIEDFAGLNTGRGALPKKDGTLEQVRFAAVTTNFFHLMGARILLGRDFTPADGQPQAPQPQAGNPNAPAAQRLPTIAILSYDYFERRYGGDASIIGHPIARAGTGGPLIVGVLAPGFELLFPPAANVERNPDVWIAARLSYDNAERNNVSLQAVGRLRDGATLQRAQSEADEVASELRRNFPIANTAGFYIHLEPMREYLVAEVRPALIALMGAVIFLLLIACANVANLMLVRMSLRERELAVRTSLGGSWWRLVRQTLAEALLLSAVGALAGLGLAWLGIKELLALKPANLPRLESISIDPAVFGFTIAAGLIAAALFGIVPAIRAARPNVMTILRGSSRTMGLAGGGWLRNFVVVIEVALCFALLIGSGLMFRSFLALQHVNLGYDPHHLLTFQLLGARAPDAPDARAALMRQIRQRISSIPGVESVTGGSPFPLTGGFYPIRWGTEEALADASKFQAVNNMRVLPGYFEAMRTPLIAGRTFTEADNSPTRNLVVVDQALASKAFPNESAVGKRILIRIRSPQPEWVEIIGVVAHARDVSLSEPGREEIYTTDGFLGHGTVDRWAVRTQGDPNHYAADVRKAIRSLGPHFLITEMQPMDTLVELAGASTRFSLLLIGLFAVIAAVLAGVGLYGVLSTLVRQRTAEIGVRMAFGASPSGIFKLVVGSGLRLSGAGIVVGVIAALMLTRGMRSMLVGVKPADPLTFVVMAALFLAISALASWLPARRASVLDPTVALRDV